MASGYKSHKTELVAIYKLEFYRKQKNWKFASDTKKPAKTVIKTPRSKYTKLRKTLNETYNIEREATNESSPLNNGFLDDVPGKDSNSPEPTPAPANTLCEDPVHSLPWSARQEYLEPERDNQLWWNVEQEVYSEPAWPDPVSPQDYGEAWPADHAAWAYDYVDAPQPWPQDIQMEELVGALERCGADTDLSEQLEQPGACAAADTAADVDVDAESSCDSLSEFIRGAHLAPHSTETDLHIDTKCCWCSLPPARLSSRALEGGVRAHAHTLTKLLRETALRNRTKLSRTCCSEQLLPLPTSQWVHPQPLSRQDTFTVSCTNLGAFDDLGNIDSINNIGTVGRGRGRLHRERVIGIGMGRPYRLA